MRTFATKQPNQQDATHQKPVRANSTPVVRSQSKPLGNTPFPDFTNSAILQRQPACACGGGCPRCSNSKNRQLLQINLSPQEQLSSVVPNHWQVSQPDSVLENQADRLAQKIVDDNDTTSLYDLQDSHNFNRQNSGASNAQFVSLLGNSGKPLEREQKAFFESKLQVDLSDVRIHTGSESSRMAENFNAEAFVVGQDIVFGENYYQPNTSQGKLLLAHELAHVAQQQSLVSNKPMILRRVLRNATVNHWCGSRDAFLRSPPSGHLTLTSSESQITVSSNIRWDRASGCPDGGDFDITLMQKDRYWFIDSDRGTETFAIGRIDSHSWTGLDGGADYWLEIRSTNTNPNCCLTGTIDISAT